MFQGVLPAYPNGGLRHSRKYPVLYLLHGDRQGANAWLRFGHVANVLDGMIANGIARPMIVVMPRGYGDEKFLSAGVLVGGFPQEVNGNTNLFSEMLMNEIIPRVEADYAVSHRCEDHAIFGLFHGRTRSTFNGVSKSATLIPTAGYLACRFAAIHPAVRGHMAILRESWLCPSHRLKIEKRESLP